MPMQAISAGLLAGLVGFASSFAVVLQGFVAMGASPSQAASGLMAVSIAMGLCGVLLSLWKRMPISCAWSTPGAALMAASIMPAGGFAEAVGAFIICALLLILAGLWKPLGRAVAAIPASLANAMLAGILFGLCLAPVRAVAEAPIAALAIIVRKELLIPIFCMVFLVENLSVMIQVSYFKYTKKKFGEGKRIFLMSPLHHHYQKKGYHESKIVTRFWIVGILLAILSIVTLKLR